MKTISIELGVAGVPLVLYATLGGFIICMAACTRALPRALIQSKFGVGPVKRSNFAALFDICTQSRDPIIIRFDAPRLRDEVRSDRMAFLYRLRVVGFDHHHCSWSL
jgi:hypothetical protein